MRRGKWLNVRHVIRIWHGQVYQSMTQTTLYVKTTITIFIFKKKTFRTGVNYNDTELKVSGCFQYCTWLIMLNHVRVNSWWILILYTSLTTRFFLSILLLTFYRFWMDCIMLYLPFYDVYTFSNGINRYVA